MGLRDEIEKLTEVDLTSARLVSCALVESLYCSKQDFAIP